MHGELEQESADVAASARCCDAELRQLCAKLSRQRGEGQAGGGPDDQPQVVGVGDVQLAQGRRGENGAGCSLQPLRLRIT